ncbi:hypothetical protein ACFQI7_25155 [Paenibacillus allorhizosphaerae]|uniref:Exo-alpha-sialidase n=1 Tax=Paenibacillus allorhizosphaerae TaxID=2849866 RepID=A0ABN7TL49_9BACL|nr:hypothetical protein [Paenibacillus allorhizosphaerae]CAG7645007.1 hypothetical protein PAECIP111802_03407 [Paenibacillus allorhizosphaerae]
MRTEKLALIAVLVMFIGCGCGNQVRQETTALPEPREKTVSGNEPVIWVNGTSLKKRIDNFIFSPDMKTMLFEEVAGRSFAIYETHMQDGAWSAPVTPTFSISSVHEGTPFLSSDTRKVYFHSFRSFPGQQPSASLDLWVADKKEQGWSEPQRIGIPKAKPDDFHYYPSVSANGTVYFTSFRSDSKGKDDIYRSRFVNGAYSEPEHLGDEINSADIDAYPSISPDESILLFGRSSDLFVSYNKDGRWTEAKPLGLQRWGIRKLRSPRLSNDQKNLYFVGEKDGVAHIFQIGWPLS